MTPPLHCGQGEWSGQIFLKINVLYEAGSGANNIIHFKSVSHVNKDTLDTILLSKVVLRDNGQSKLYDYSRWYAPILFPSANWSGWQMARWQWLEKSPAVIAITCHLLSPYTCPPYPPVATKRLNCVQQMRRCLLSGAPASLEWFGHQETHWLLASVPTDTFDTGCNHCNVFSTLVLGCSWVLGKCPNENPMFLESPKWVHSKQDWKSVQRCAR